ncbi:hypothetical protein OTB20_19460 [Streptomyces sp. H27-H1]|uniref:hypothetical protein n=1 Tax=Streptomyces sp. H27-H1 TaxID=2996461 RepID=UPI00227080D1|nr:hypothetical protein [Streptomyces sp. H27-H1]MCY0928335.1 hypothetical protein [Streptomyces sp. H27-H1]
MTASAQSGHSIIDQPATVEQCAAEYKAAQPDDDDGPGYARVQLGGLGTGQQHTHR